MRVLAIAQLVQTTAANGEPALGGFFHFRFKARRNSAVIGCSARESLRRQMATNGQRGLAIVGVHGLQHLVEIAHIGADGHMVVVLRRGADHGRPTHIDLLDAGVDIGAGAGGFFERIQIDHQQVDLGNAVLGHRRQIILAVTTSQQAAMNARMQGFHPAIHHFGVFGDTGDVARIQSGVAQGLQRTACGQKLDPRFSQLGGAFGETGFIRNGNQRPLERGEARIIHGNVLPDGANLTAPGTKTAPYHASRAAGSV